MGTFPFHLSNGSQPGISNLSGFIILPGPGESTSEPEVTEVLENVRCTKWPTAYVGAGENSFFKLMGR